MKSRKSGKIIELQTSKTIDQISFFFCTREIFLLLSFLDKAVQSRHPQRRVACTMAGVFVLPPSNICVTTMKKRKRPFARMTNSDVIVVEYPHSSLVGSDALRKMRLFQYEMYFLLNSFAIPRVTYTNNHYFLHRFLFVTTRNKK